MQYRQSASTRSKLICALIGSVAVRDTSPQVSGKQRDNVNYHASKWWVVRKSWQLLYKVVFLIKHLSVLSVQLNYNSTDKFIFSLCAAMIMSWTHDRTQSTPTLQWGWIVHEIQRGCENLLDSSYGKIQGVRHCLWLTTAFCTFQSGETQVCLAYWREACECVPSPGCVWMVLAYWWLFLCLSGMDVWV